MDKPCALSLRDAVDHLLRINPAPSEQNGNHLLRIHFRRHIADLLVRILFEGSQDPLIQLLFWQRRFQVDFRLQLSLSQAVGKVSACRQNQRSRHAEMREHHLAKSVPGLPLSIENPKRYILQRQTLHLRQIFLRAAKRDKRRAARLHRMTRLLRKSVPVTGRARRRIGKPSCRDHNRSRRKDSPVGQTDTCYLPAVYLLHIRPVCILLPAVF